MRLRNVLPIAAIIIAVVIILSLKGCNSGEAGPPTDATTTATHETANHTGKDPTNYESSEAGNSPVSESTHESTEATASDPANSNPNDPTHTNPSDPTNTNPNVPGHTEPSDPAHGNTDPSNPGNGNSGGTSDPKPTEPKPTEPKPTNPVHTHSWSAWNQSKAPTCTASGEEVRTCSCGAKESRTVNALGHNWSGWSQTKAPTCGAEGTEGRSCSRCGASESRSVPATGNHSWNETAPTCTEAGSKTCKVCGKTESGSAALGHDWVHHDEEGHSVCVCTCYCGEVFYSYDEWHAHARASYDDDYLNAHAGYWCYFDWVVDVPAYDVCSRCGMTK